MKDKPKIKTPAWAETALQGVTFWMGHRHSLYHDYPLAEAALVAETCNLINANLQGSSSLRLRCEVMYLKKILPKRTKVSKIISSKARADLVVGKIAACGNEKLDFKPEFVIEVKRLSTGKKEIKKDLQRLSEVHSLCPSIRAFLFLFSERKLPTDFVGLEGTAKRGRTELNPNGYYVVRRVLKAAKSFRRGDYANYACLIEVFS